MAGPSPKKPAAAPPKNPFAKRLAGMKQRWDNAREESKKDFVSNNVDDGKYATKLSDARILEGKENSIGVLFEFTIIDGDFTGEKLTRWSGFDTDERVVYLQRDLRRMGVDVDEFDIEQLPDCLEALLAEAPGVRCTVQTKGDYKNVYIDKLIQLDEDGSVPVEEAPAEEGAGEAEATEEPGEAAEGEAAEGEQVEEPAEENVEEAAEFEKGDEVAFKHKGKKVSGVVLRVNADDTLLVKTDKGEKIPVDKDICEKIAQPTGEAG